jgi:hypothetical protein
MVGLETNPLSLLQPRWGRKKKARQEAGQVVDDLMLLSGDCDAGFSDPANLEGVPAKARGRPQVFGRECRARLSVLSGWPVS